MNIRFRTQAVILLLAMATLLITAGDAAAQQLRPAPTRPARAAPAEEIDFTAMYGHMWGGHLSTDLGTFRLGTAPSMFFALDIPMETATWVELSYGHQSGELNLDRSLAGTTTICDMSINYWQLGMIRGVHAGAGNIIPYGSLSLGLTYLNPSADRFDVDGETYPLDSTTKFSVTLGVGVKAFFGEAQRYGLRASFKTIPTFYGSSTSLWFGTGGASVGISGYGVWQWEAAGGLVVKLG